VLLDAVPDVELVVPVGVPDVFALVLDELDGVELDVADGAEPLDVDAEFPELGAVEVCVGAWPEPASGSVYCWSPADGPVASTVAGANRAAARHTIRQMNGLNGICGGQVLHSA
jgi:hypothetical protein